MIQQKAIYVYQGHYFDVNALRGYEQQIIRVVHTRFYFYFEYVNKMKTFEYECSTSLMF